MLMLQLSQTLALFFRLAKADTEACLDADFGIKIKQAGVWLKMVRYVVGLFNVPITDL